MACHVASYTAVQLGATIAITRAFGYRVTPTALLAGAAINAGTHAAIDRGAVLLWLAKKTKKTGYIEHCQAVRLDDEGRSPRSSPGRAVHGWSWTRHSTARSASGRPPSPSG
ncbi:hypothetical protein NKH18_01130 [Streptomyces sp. M10(2022)]